MRRAALLTLLLVVPLTAGCGGGGDDIAALPPGSFVSASGELGPPIHLFGDTINADVSVVVDRTKLDPGRVSLKTFFEPYEPIEEMEVARREAGSLAEIRYQLRLRCLQRACITSTLGTIQNPGGSAPRTFRFQPAQVQYTDPGAEQARLLRTVRFTPIESVTRINAQDVTQVYGFPFRGSFSPLPALSQRISATTLGLLLLLLAAALLVLPLTLVLRWWRARRQPPPPEPEPEPTPLERAIALVEWSLERENGAERRAALDALATELDVVESDGLADQTRIAAWSPPSPSTGEAERILALVMERHGDA
jgi:hypothetical protein